MSRLLLLRHNLRRSFIELPTRELHLCPRGIGPRRGSVVRERLWGEGFLGAGIAGLSSMSDEVFQVLRLGR
jgi:hypothetical protein